MKDKVIEILGMPKNEESVTKLCELCGIKKFQANNLMDEYAKIKSTEEDLLSKGMDPAAFAGQKQVIIKGLTSGEFAKSEVVANDLRNEVIKLLTSPITEENIKNLSELCNQTLENSKIYINNYQVLTNNEKILISQGQDPSEQTNQKLDIINKLSQIN